MPKPQPRAEKNATTLPKKTWANDRTVAYLLGAFAFLLYVQTTGFGYALDDVAVITGNGYVKAGFGGFGKILSHYYWHGNPSFADSNSGLFRPLSLLLFATEWQLFGDKPGVFHFVHVLLYALTAVQLYRWLSEMIGKEGGRIALFATLLWIALPIHTEVVANLKSADEILSLLFSLLGLRFLLKWSNDSSIATLLFAAVFFLLALLSKEAAVLVLPLGLLMLLTFRGKTIGQLLAPGAVLIGFAVFWLLWHQLIIAIAGERFAYDYRHNALLSNPSKIDQLGTAIGLQARYWVKMLTGYPLSYNYSFNEIPVNGFADLWPWLSLAGIGAAAFFAAKKFRTLPVLSFAIIFYFTTMLLTANVFYQIGDIFAERFTFVPSIGFCLLVAVLLLRMGNAEFKPASTTIGILAVLCVVYSVRTFARSADWKDDRTLFPADVEHSPNSARVHGNVGVIHLNDALADSNELTKRQKFELAFTEYSAAYEIDNRDYNAAAALGQILYHKGDFNASVVWSERSISIRRQLLAEQKLPLADDWSTLQNTADAFVRLGQYDSMQFYYHAAAVAASSPQIYEKAGNAYLRAKDTAHAIAAYYDLVEFDSTYTAGWDKIANLKGMRRDYAGSNEAFLKIAALKPDDPNPWRMIYTNYGLMGDTASAGAAAKEYYKRGGQ